MALSGFGAAMAYGIAVFVSYPDMRILIAEPGGETEPPITPELKL